MKQASINLDAVSYDENWGNNLVTVMRELAAQDTFECIEQFSNFKALPLHKNFKIDASNFYGDKIECTIKKSDDYHANLTLIGCGEKKIWNDFPLHLILEAPKGERTFFDNIWQTKTEKPLKNGLENLPIYKFLKKNAEEIYKA